MAELSLSTAWIDEYGEIAGLAAIYELGLRLLADKVPELKSKSHSKSLEELEDAVISYFQAHLKSEGVKLLKEGRRLRNNLLHSDFEAAVEKAEAINPGAISSSGVVAIDLKNNTFKVVSKESSKVVGIYGWLLEAKTGGLFESSRRIFVSMIATIGNLSHEAENR